MSDPAHPHDTPQAEEILNGQVIYIKRGRLNKFGFEPAWNAYFDFYLSSKYLEKPILQLEDVTFHLWLRKNLNDDDPNWQIPSIPVMKRRFGVGQNKIEAMLDRLAKAHLLKKISGKGSGDKGANVTNTYELSDPIQNLEDFLLVAAAGEFPQPLKKEWEQLPPLPKMGKAPLPETGTPPLPKMGKHKHTSNIKQTTVAKAAKQNNNNSSGELAKNVVVALIDKGISQSVAERMASRYSEARIYEKIDYLNYLLEHAPDKVTNPRGWLRRAIEENYGPPDGYQTKAEREQAAAAQKQRQEEQQRLAEAHKQHEAATSAAAAAELAKKRQAALTSYDTAPELIDLWEKQILPRLQSPLALANSLLVALNGTEATVWLPSKFLLERVERQHLKDICRLLAKHLQVSLPEVKVKLVSPETQDEE